MEKLESNLNNEDLEIYKKVKNFFINRYKNYNRSINFSSKKGLISYVDALLSKYATYTVENTFNILPDIAQRKITNISSIASSEEDAFIMSSVLLDFISNCHAAMVNGGVKFAVYSIMYLSDLGAANLQFNSIMTLIVKKFISSNAEISNPAYDSYLQVLDATNLIKYPYFSDILFAIISAIFSYVEKLIIYFSNFFSEDERLKKIAYKQSIAVIQTQIKYLTELFLADFLVSIKFIFPKFGDSLSDYYLNYLNFEILTAVSSILPSAIINTDLNFTKNTDSINISYFLDLENIIYNLIPDTTSFSEFLDTIDDDYFLESKENLVNTIYNQLKA